MTWKIPPGLPTPDVAQLKTAHEELIRQAGLEIHIIREAKSPMGGSSTQWYPEPRDGIDTFARVFLTGGGSSNVSEPTIGHQERDTSWGLLLPLESDGVELPLQPGDGGDGRTRLEFLHPEHGRLRIRRLRPWTVSLQMVGWQADLEAIAYEPDRPLVTPHPGRPRLEDDPRHPWRAQLAVAEQLRDDNPRMSWSQIAAEVGISADQLEEYRRRAPKSQV
jgi:hypothetical protein